MYFFTFKYKKSKTKKKLRFNLYPEKSTNTRIIELKDTSINTDKEERY